MKPNILFIVIDSLRADKCYGNRKTSVTPNIDSLISDGVYFTQAFSSAAATTLAVSSILTGLYPCHNGMGGKTYDKLDSKILNYVKVLKDNGYNTYSSTPQIATDFGLTYDFENIDSSHDNYFSLFAGLGDQILEKFSSNKLKEPWFFYLHLFDLHTPVIVPNDYTENKFGMSQYEKMVSAIDSWIGEFLKKIDREHTLIILTSDHGEYIPVVKHGVEIINLEPGLTETNLWSIGNKIPKSLYPVKKKFGSLLRKVRKKSKFSKISNLSLTSYQKRILLESRMGYGHRMYDDLLHVPLVFSGYNIHKNIKISHQVRHIDIFPTILDLISTTDKSEKDGTSLLPLFSNNKMDELPACIESPPSIHSGSKKSVGIRTNNYKYIRDIDHNGDILELYDLQNDPFEEKNIANSNKPMVEKMENLLNLHRGQTNLKQKKLMSSEEIKKIEDKLKKLGYR